MLTVYVKHELDDMTFDRVSGIKHKRNPLFDEALSPVHSDHHPAEHEGIRRKVSGERRGNGGGANHPLEAVLGKIIATYKKQNQNLIECYLASYKDFWYKTFDM